MLVGHLVSRGCQVDPTYLSFPPAFLPVRHPFTFKVKISTQPKYLAPWRDGSKRIILRLCEKRGAKGRQADPPATPSAFDQAEFLRIAESQYGVIDESFEDGSTLTVMQLAYTICEGDISVLRANLASRWDSSFQKFAIESVCPEKLN